MKPNKITFKYLIRQLHLILGLSSGLIVFIVAIAGSLYIFEEEGRDIFQHRFYHVENPGNARLPFQHMMDTVKTHFPKEKITSIRFKEAKDAAIIFYIKKDRAVSINPYTSKVIGVQNLKSDFFTVDLNLHTHLLLGDTGAIIIKCNVLIFFIMCISGLILWWPKQRRFFRQAATINFKTGNWKRLNWDLHRVLGFYALVVLLIISWTGIFFVYDSAKSMVAFITHSPLPKKEKKLKSKPVKNKHYTLDDAYGYMRSTYPGAEESFLTPATDSAAAIRVLMRYPYTVMRRQNSVYFNQYSGKILKAELDNNHTAYDAVAQSNYNLHTGRFRVIGIGSKIIWFICGLTAASLPVTGFMIWLGRRKKYKPQLKQQAILS